MGTRKSTTLDVRPILASGADPFTTIRARVDALEVGEELEVVAPFLPAPLIELLKGEGFSVRVERRNDGGWRVNFRRD
jgi:uncharacterized protein (DUF2249 family)